jgi:glycerol-3-phosphate acyltransferase PlsX
LRPGLSAFRKRLDYTEYGAAPLLGIDGLCLKCHGSSDAKTLKNAVRQARIAIKNRLVQAISDEFSKWEAGDGQ